MEDSRAEDFEKTKEKILGLEGELADARN